MRLFKSEKGNVAVIVSLVLTAILGMSGFVIDMGTAYVEKANLANAIDAALLAGAQELPTNKIKAKSIMETYLVENGVALEDVEISIAADGLRADINARKNVDFTFSKVLGIDNAEVDEDGGVILGTASSARGGLRPFGVTKDDFTYGDLVVLKEGAGDGYHGNYGMIALGGNGASVLIYNMLYGYDGEVKVGDFIDTEPGNIASSVRALQCYLSSYDEAFDDFERGSARVWTIPLFETMEVNGREAIQVVGFAHFFVEDVYKRSGKAEVHGRFIEYVTSGEIDNSLEFTGTYAMKLVD